MSQHHAWQLHKYHQEYDHDERVPAGTLVDYHGSLTQYHGRLQISAVSNGVENSYDLVDPENPTDIIVWNVRRKSFTIVEEGE